MTTVVIGAGHNGLTAAFYLAKAGLEPIVFERAETFGGGAVTGELHPGFRCPTLNHHVALRSDIIADMQLARHGVEFLNSPVEVFAPALAGPAAVIYGDDQRYVDTYWSRYEGRYFPGDGAKRDEEGYFWLLGRVDDIMLVSGHNISTTEVESALVSHVSVAEAAVVGRKDDLTGQAIAAFVTLRGDVVGDEVLLQELRDHVAHTLGPIAKPKSIVFTDDLPKTRSGKIMRRLLQDISEHRQLGDVTTLANEAVVNEIAVKASEATED